jgi:dissimilatory sulfite reductase (desulfoviridin) alpha/beta subunit
VTINKTLMRTINETFREFWLQAQVQNELAERIEITPGEMNPSQIRRAFSMCKGDCFDEVVDAMRVGGDWEITEEEESIIENRVEDACDRKCKEWLDWFLDSFVEGNV